MKIQALVDRFGSNRMNAAEPGKLLRGCSCIAVPFAGGMCEIPHFTANVILVNDLDRNVINLARTVRYWREELVSQLAAMAFHPDELADAQRTCLAYAGDTTTVADLKWAVAYFASSWMTRGGKGGTEGEFDAGLSIRWKSGGGDSVIRFRNATEGLAEWEKVMRRCTFTALDGLDFLDECLGRDIPENGIYADPPWIEDGAKYTHNIDPLRLCDKLAAFEHTRIVVRYGDHPTVRELYPESHWQWHLLNGRTQANKAKTEVLLVRRRP